MVYNGRKINKYGDHMKTITFIDLEISEDSKRILDYGAIKSSGQYLHESSLQAFQSFLAETDYLCGHNVIHFDLVYLNEVMSFAMLNLDRLETKTIDTLYLSPLLFPQRPYHALSKDDKLQSEELNNPLNDAKKAQELFYDEVEAYKALPELLRRIYYALLHNRIEFEAFFEFMDYRVISIETELEIRDLFQDYICNHANIVEMIERNPIELAYTLALIHVNDEYSITPAWILKKYPMVDVLMHQLRGIPCLTGCKYCNQSLNAKIGLKRFFGYDAYRNFDGIPLQEQAVEAAIHNKSLLAVFPTGGGKSITFQVPALMAGYNTKGLTVVISPLQSLMKDQVDNLEKNGITDAVTINGLLDPLERAESIRRVGSGEATILYISPESLRSRTVERLLLNRKVVRFVIDEAHCFSAWGQDFRVDYLYIADFIKKLCQEKHLPEMIPVSCFTATAKQNVIEDIHAYFRDNLNIELELFTAGSGRKNLHYKVIEKHESEKYEEIRNLLAYKQCPTIIYVSRTKKAEELVEALQRDGYLARAYHGKMDKKEKSDNQDAFIRGDVDIMVATSAFGMGVDKKDVGMVIHYDISDSLENYVQEAGRAGRDQKIQADCYVLFDEEDLNKHFVLLNQSKISVVEIQQVWKAIKEATRTRARMSNSALEIARHAGWDENVAEVETRVKTAIAALEDAGYIKRGQNVPHVFADSIMAKSMMEAGDKIRQSGKFNQKEEEMAIRIVKMMIATRSRQKSKENVAETRVDYIADTLGIEKRDVLQVIQTLREAKVLTDAKDLTVYMDENGTITKAMAQLKVFREIEEFIFQSMPEEETVLNLKELNELAQEAGIKKVSPERIHTIINFWVIKDIAQRTISRISKNMIKIKLKQSKVNLYEQMKKRWDVAELNLQCIDDINMQNDTTVNFSVLELTNAYNFERQLLQMTASTKDVEDALFYLSRIGAIRIEGGFLVTYNGLSIERLERDNKIRYKLEDYKRLKQYYEQKTQMIHIVGEYAKKLLGNYQEALQFVDDYFQLDYNSFIRKYFKGTRDEEIQRNITPSKFYQLFGELSPAQLKIIKDKQSQYIVVAAGPGSGKTRILVHKLASLLLMEDIKHEQMLMLTFSRAAATEFKKRLLRLIGNAANYVEIRTFHSFSFDLLGKVGNIEKSEDIVKEAAIQIENGEVEASRVAKTVLVIDEAQDMDENEFRLVKALMDRNDEMRVIAVGDDDQNIYAFRGSDAKYMQNFLSYRNAKLYELIENYRSKANLISFTNVFAEGIPHRLKTNTIMPVKKNNGQIHIIEYHTKQLVLPVVQKMLQGGIHGSTCILTKTNDEALQIAALLQKNNVHAKLIQANENLDLYNLIEIRYFLSELHLREDTYHISQEVWKNAKIQLKRKYGQSKNYAICERMILDFEEINQKCMFVSDWIEFLHESREEDFYRNCSICVSTIHKSKGWEFEHVILVLSDFYLNSEEVQRQLYVGMTRAKESLTIHYNGNYFRDSENPHYMGISQVKYQIDPVEYQLSGMIRRQLGYHDVYLSYFYRSQRSILGLMSGGELHVTENGCQTLSGRNVLMFSSKFKEEIQQFKKKGYQLSLAKINHIFYWNEENKEEIEILFPEIEFNKL